MFFKGYIKIREMAVPIRNWIFLWTVKSVMKKGIIKAAPGRYLVLHISGTYYGRNNLLMCQDEDENQSFRSFLHVLKQTCDNQTNTFM